ncbi:DNA endonuclease SmrA [Agaribacter flavus]|uniref:DNA endonuclease SmrA n=1 Tax=Agaribacter flavus TaxID=1902781 RepID=A0ABV7FRU9_9ALTE
MTSEANDLSFYEEMADVKPLVVKEKFINSSSRPPSLAQTLKRQAIEKQTALDDNGLSIEYVNPVAPLDFISYKKDGVQEGVYKNLRLGKYHIDSRLVLKHLGFDDARLSLYQTITECHERGVRTLLIDHGIGKNSQPFPAFIKSYVNQWLQEMDAVIAFHTALKQHGGLGAVYVLLKKHPNQKLLNREKHQKR